MRISVNTGNKFSTFGSTQPNTNNLNANQYRYGFGGMEQDKQTGSYTTYFRQYDPRIARWKSTDPVTQPWQSPYTAFDNNPILYVDPMGDVSWCGIGTVFSGLASFAGNMALRALPTLGLNIALNNFLPNATHTGNNSGSFFGADGNVGGGGDFTLESLRQNYVEGFKQSLTDKFGPLDFSSADALATSYFESIKDPLTFFSISNVQMLQDVTAILQNMPSYTANDYAYAAGYVSVDVLMAVVMKKYGGRVKGKKKPKPTPNFITPTNPPQLPPAQLPAGHTVRVMPATQQYPSGYWVQYNQYGQPVNPMTGKPPANVTRPQARSQTHVPLPTKK